MVCPRPRWMQTQFGKEKPDQMPSVQVPLKRYEALAEDIAASIANGTLQAGRPPALGAPGQRRRATSARRPCSRPITCWKRAGWCGRGRARATTSRRRRPRVPPNRNARRSPDGAAARRADERDDLRDAAGGGVARRRAAGLGVPEPAAVPVEAAGPRRWRERDEARSVEHGRGPHARQHRAAPADRAALPARRRARVDATRSSSPTARWRR